MIPVLSSTAKYSKTSAIPMSTLLPILATLLNRRSFAAPLTLDVEREPAAVRDERDRSGLHRDGGDVGQVRLGAVDTHAVRTDDPDPVFVCDLLDAAFETLPLLGPGLREPGAHDVNGIDSLLAALLEDGGDDIRSQDDDGEVDRPRDVEHAVVGRHPVHLVDGRVDRVDRIEPEVHVRLDVPIAGRLRIGGSTDDRERLRIEDRPEHLPDPLSDQRVEWLR